MRTRICRKCGKVFEVPTGKDAYLCKECAKKSKADSVLRERTCKICGEKFMGYPRSFFCPECSARRKKQQKKIYNQRKPARPLGSTDICEACGKTYVVHSWQQRYCPKCAKDQVANNIRAHKRKYMAKNKEKSQALKDDTRGKRYVCVICGKEFEKHTTQITCSPECQKEYLRRKQNMTDIRRGKRKLSADQRYVSGLPKSGVVGVTWNRKSHKWQAAYKRKYIGLYETVEQAEIAIQKYAEDNNAQQDHNRTDQENHT